MITRQNFIILYWQVMLAVLRIQVIVLVTFIVLLSVGGVSSITFFPVPL